MALLSYKDAHRLFPDEPTLDQFFEEDQFEAYRELGWVVADLAVNGTQTRSVSVASGQDTKHWLVCGRLSVPPPKPTPGG
jgi:hypothetical protein